MAQEHITIPKKCCLHCHFLVCQDERSATQSDRERLLRQINNEDISEEHPLRGYRCFHKVWTPPKKPDEVTEELRPDPKDRINNYDRMIENRKNTCFFYPYSPRMSLTIAIELERRKRDLRVSQRAFWIAISALVVSIASLLLNWWAHCHPQSP